VGYDNGITGSDQDMRPEFGKNDAVVIPDQVWTSFRK
jgi:hypothetical protein